MITGLSREQSSELRARLEEYAAQRDRVRRLPEHWAEQRSAVLAGRDHQVRTQAHRVKVDVGHAAFLEGVTIDGSALDTSEKLDQVRHRIAAERRLGDALRAVGRPVTRDWEDPAARLARLQEGLQDLEQLLELSRLRTALVEAAEGVPSLAALDWADEAEDDRLVLVLAAVDAEHEAAPARELIGRTLKVLRNWSDKSITSRPASPSPCAPPVTLWTTPTPKATKVP